MGSAPYFGVRRTLICVSGPAKHDSTAHHGRTGAKWSGNVNGRDLAAQTGQVAAYQHQQSTGQ
ncbi:MAG: hypothetical protein NVS2B16_07850 [Chloroflexota bacterium]